MMENIISNIICTTFENEVKRGQVKNEKQFALFMSFCLSIDYDKEEGYRHLDFLIYGPLNYVGVLVRERWVVIPNDEVSDDGDGLKPGCDYRKGDSGWLLASYHDSCWTSDGVQSTIYKNRERIKTLSTNFKNWYEKIEMTPDLIETFEILTSSNRTRENYYEVSKNVFKF